MNTYRLGRPEACELMYDVNLRSFGLGKVRWVAPRRLVVKARAAHFHGRQLSHKRWYSCNSTLTEIWQECVDVKSKHAEIDESNETDNACAEKRGDKLCCRRQGEGLRRLFRSHVSPAIIDRAQCRSLNCFALLKKLKGIVSVNVQAGAQISGYHDEVMWQ